MRSKKAWLVALIVVVYSMVLAEPAAEASDATAAPLPSAWQVPMDSNGGLDDEPVKPRSSYKSPATSGMLAVSLTLASYSVLGVGAILSDNRVAEEFAVASIIVGGAGALVAPSAGHMYSGAWRHTAWSMSGRALCGLAVPLFAWPAPALSVLAGAGFVVISIYDVVDAFFVQGRLRRRKARMRRTALLPTVLPTGGGEMVPGLVWAGRF